MGIHLWGKKRSGQQKLWHHKHMWREGSCCNCQPYLNATASMKTCLWREKPCISIGKLLARWRNPSLMLAPQPSASEGISSSLLRTCCSFSFLSRQFQPWQIFGLPGCHISLLYCLRKWSSYFEGSLMFWN